MKFTKQQLQKMAWEDSPAMIKQEDEIVDHSRWSVIHDVVFSFDGKFYESSYSVGATEQQDESPYEYDEDEIECAEVEQVVVATKVWRKV